MVVCTESFVGLVNLARQSLRMPELSVVPIRHPLGGEPPEVVRERARQAVEQVVAALTGG